jgi:hypothetical protein
MTDLQKRSLSWLKMALLIAFIWLVFVFPTLSQKRSFAISVDNESLLAPILAHMSAVQQGWEWPLWMDSVMGGLPLHNMTQLSAYYPFYFTAMPWFSDPISASRSMHLITLLHLLLFTGNAFILLRTIGVSRAAALAGAVLMVFNANMLSYCCWLNIIAPYAWLPLYLAGLLRLFKHPGSGKALAMTLFAIVMLTLASPAQPLIHAVFLTVILVLAQIYTRIRAAQKLELLKSLASLALVAVTAALLAAPALLPALLEFADMYRWLGSFAIVGHQPIPFNAFLTDQLLPGDLFGTFFRFGDGRLVGSQFIGALPMILAAFAVLSWPLLTHLRAPVAHDLNQNGARLSAASSDLPPLQSWIILPVLFVALYALLSSAGENLGFAQINYEIPLLNKIREPSRFLVLAHFAIGILAAIGLDAFAQLNFRALKFRSVAFIGSAALWLMALGVALVFRNQIANQVLIASLLLLIPGAVLLARLVSHQQFSASKRVGFAACVVIAAQYLQVPWRALEIRTMDYLAGNQVELDLALREVVKLDPEHRYRVIFEGDIQKAQAAMLASYYGMRTLNVYINPAPKRQFDELYYHGPRSGKYFRGLGAAYLLCKPCQPEKTEGYTWLKQIGSFNLYSTSALPRTYLATSSAGEYQSMDEFISKLTQLDLSAKPVLLRKDVLDSGMSGLLPAGAQPAAMTAQVCVEPAVETRHNRFIALLQCQIPSLFVLNEFDNGNWRARINGAGVPTIQVNGNQLAVAIPAGAQRLELYYRPTSWVMAMKAFALGCFLVLGYLFWRVARAART